MRQELLQLARSRHVPLSLNGERVWVPLRPGPQQPPAQRAQARFAGRFLVDFSRVTSEPADRSKPPTLLQANLATVYVDQRAALYIGAPETLAGVQAQLQSNVRHCETVFPGGGTWALEVLQQIPLLQPQLSEQDVLTRLYDGCTSKSMLDVAGLLCLCFYLLLLVILVFSVYCSSRMDVSSVNELH